MKNTAKRRRAIELFVPNSPFKPKTVNSKKIYSRKRKENHDGN